jgi:hypothetical protein
MSAKIYLAGLFLLLLAPSFALGETWQKNDEAWEKMHENIDWVELLERKGLKVVPADSAPKKKNRQISQADRDELTKLILKSLAEFEEAEKLAPGDRCHKTTNNERSFNECIQSDQRVLSSQGRQNLKKAPAQSNSKAGMPSLDAMGNSTGAE